MRFLVMNVGRNHGISKKNGRPFDFTIMTAYKSKVENSEDFKGMKSIFFSCEKELLKKISVLPSVCDIEYDVEPNYDGKPQMTVTSLEVVNDLDIHF